MQPGSDRVLGVFEVVADLPPGERSAYLERACAGEPELRARVEALLAADDRAAEDHLLSGAAMGPAPTALAAAPEQPGAMVGRYKLLQAIGEGGFGTVFMAEQREPIVRRVALKIIKWGMDTKQVIARFEAERQALAMMDHPNIAKVFDAGATEAGRPYFVMELVRGESITDYCDKQSLGIEARLGLFRQVCQAVQHAHSKGIIHRDVKPGNVLVTIADGKPVPKVIDFGIAKAIHHRLTERTVFTEFRQLIGTPEYMSPEQAEASGVDVDTRTDIYSLGVLLYELLTGTVPFEPRRLRSAALAEIQRIIREENPPKPSTRMTTAGASATTLARTRGGEPGALAKRLRGELDWIVMKALDKDRARRYETAAAFADDVARVLAQEPVVAGPPSAGYRLRTFARRHRVGVGVAAAVGLATLAGLAGTSAAAVWAVRERDRADDREADARQSAEALGERVQAHELSTRRVAEFMANYLGDATTQFTALTRRALVEDNGVPVLDADERPVYESRMPEIKARIEHAWRDYRRQSGGAWDVRGFVQMLESSPQHHPVFRDLAALGRLMERLTLVVDMYAAWADAFPPDLRERMQLVWSERLEEAGIDRAGLESIPRDEAIVNLRETLVRMVRPEQGPRAGDLLEAIERCLAATSAAEQAAASPTPPPSPTGG